MFFRRLDIEKESAEEHGYENIKYNLGESSVPDRSLGDLDVDLDEITLSYGKHGGFPKLRALIAEQYPSLSSKQIVVTNGASEALFLVAACLLVPGDHVIIEQPNYPSNYEVPRSLGCEVKALQLQSENDFQLNPDALQDIISPNTQLVSVTHPHNPTGSMISKDVMERLIEISAYNDSYLIFDETYRDLTFGEKLPPAASLSPQAISISTLSKAFGFPGIRIGWLAVNDNELIETCLAAKEQINICNSVLDEAIALEILKNKEQLLSLGKDHLNANFQVLQEWLHDRNELEYVIPQGGAVCFPQIRQGINISLSSFYQLLMERYQTFVGPGHWFGMEDRNFRIGYGWPSSSELQIGLNNLTSALNDVKGR